MFRTRGHRKICVVGSSKRFFGGITTHTIFLANALSNRNEVSVILLRNLLPRFLYPGKGQVGRKDCSIDFVPGVKVYEGMDWNFPLSWFRACSFLKEQKPQAIIMLWWTSSVAHMQLFLALANRFGIKAKLILEMHEIVDPLEESILPIRLYSRLMGRWLMRQTDMFTTQSASAKEQVARIYKISEERIVVVPIGLYDDYKRTCDKSSAKKELGIEEEFVILHFGLIRKYKGIPYLVDAFNKLPKPVASSSKLLIVGEDWGDESSLDDMIESSPYRAQITLQPKFVPDDMIPKYFSAADVVALPYLRTCGSGVAHIAMAYGRPIITSEIDTMGECLKDYKGAMFAPAGDSTVLKERLLEVYDDCQSGKSMAYDPPQNTWDEIARRYESIFSQLEVK